MEEKMAVQIAVEADLGSAAPTYQVLLSDTCAHDGDLL